MGKDERKELKNSGKEGQKEECQEGTTKKRNEGKKAMRMNKKGERKGGREGRHERRKEKKSRK